MAKTPENAQYSNNHNASTDISTAFDLIVIGAGTAGCLLTQRLASSSTFAARSILILEAGEDRDGDVKIDIPGYSRSMFDDPNYDWCFVSETEPGLNGREVKHPRGKVVGGTSAINSHALVFPSRFYHDFWEQSLLSDSRPNGASGKMCHSAPVEMSSNGTNAQQARLDIDWTWTGMQAHYSDLYHVQKPGVEARDKLLVLPETQLTQGSESDGFINHTDTMASTGNAKEVRSFNSAGSIPHGQADRIQASFPENVYEQQKYWIETFKEADFLSESLGMDGLAFGGLTGVNAIDGRPGIRARSHAGGVFGKAMKQYPNVSIMKNVMVQQIIFSEKEQFIGGKLQANGVRFFHNGRSETVQIKPAGEVILCAGVFGSPQILELSGLGARNILADAQLPCLYDLPGVGENLQDHLNCGCSVELKDGIKSRDLELNDPALSKKAMLQYEQEKKGPIADGGAYSFAYVPSQWLASQAEQDHLQEAVSKSLRAEKQISKGTRMQYDFIKMAIQDPSEATATMFLQQRQRHPDMDVLPKTEPAAVPGNFVSVVSMLSYPFSRGSCHIISNDCFVRPQLKFNYLTHSLDRWLFRTHLRQIDRFLELPPLSQIIKPGGTRLPRTNSGKFTDVEDDRLDEIVKATVATNYHPCGTCAMMTETLGGVVDETFKVYGTSNVRVVDASVIPIIPRGNILTTVYAMAGKAAEIMLDELR